MTTLLPMAKNAFSRNPEGNVGDQRSRRMSNDIGERITFFCSKEGITIGELEEAVGVAHGSIYSVISGRRKGRISGYLVQLIADTLGMEVGLLMNGRTQHDLTLRGFNVSDVLLWAGELPPPLPRLAVRLVTPRLLPPKPESKRRRKRTAKLR